MPSSQNKNKLFFLIEDKILVITYMILEVFFNKKWLVKPLVCILFESNLKHTHLCTHSYVTTISIKDVRDAKKHEFCKLLYIQLNDNAMFPNNAQSNTYFLHCK